MHGYLSQRLHKYIRNMKEHVAVFFEEKNVIFSTVVGNTSIVFCLRLNVFTSRTTNLLLPLGDWGHEFRIRKVKH